MTLQAESCKFLPFVLNSDQSKNYVKELARLLLAILYESGKNYVFPHFGKSIILIFYHFHIFAHISTFLHLHKFRQTGWNLILNQCWILFIMTLKTFSIKSERKQEWNFEYLELCTVFSFFVCYAFLYTKGKNRM